MQIRVDKDNLRIIKLSQLESGEVDVTEVNFIFTPEYTDLSKVAVFTLGDKSYKVILQNDKCYIPTEVLVEGNKITIGVYAFKSEGEELILRYSPVPVTAEILKGSYVEEAENTSHPTPTEIEQLLNLIQSNTDSINVLSGRVDTLEEDKDKCERDIDSIKEDLIDIKSDIQDLEDDVTSINSNINNINENIEDIENEIQDINSDISNINTSITNIERVDERQDRRLNGIDNFIRQWPKTEYQTGTSINLGKTIQAVVQYEDDKVLYGDTSQETRQYIDVGEWEQGDISGSTGQEIASTSYIRTDFIPIKPNVLFEISRTIYNQYMYFRFYDINKSFLGTQGTVGMVTTNRESSGNRMQVNESSMQLTINNSNVAYMRMCDASANLSTIYTIYTDNTPSPSYSQNINVVTGTQEVVVRGKNLLNLDSFTSGSNYGVTYTKDNSQITYSGTTDRSTTVINKVYTGTTLKAGTYAISYTTSGSITRGNNLDAQFSVKKYDGTNLFTKLASQMSTNTQYSGTFTITEDTNVYLSLYVNGSGIVFNDFTIQYQIESGDTATTYEPYITPTTYQIHLGNMEFASIGNYIDFPYFNLNEGKWYKKKVIEKLILNGTENWNNTYTAFGLSELINKSIASGGGLCNYFVYDSRNSGMTSLTNYKFAIQSISGKTKSSIYIQYTDITSVADFKTWLSTHNTIVYYPLETPTDEEITDTTLIADLDNILAMMSVEGTTIIEVSGNLPGIIKVKAFAQLQAAT